MRTTIRMNEELSRRAHKFAHETSRTFTQLIEEAVTAFVSQSVEPKGKRKRITFPVSGDPKNRMTEAQYRAMIEKMYEDEARAIMRGSSDTP